jgi:Prolyl oligopeptidase, N-terminal beta-propeller domain
MSFHLSVRPSIHQSIRLSVCLSVSPSVNLSIRPSVCPSFYLSVRPSVCLFVHLSVRLPAGPSVRPFVRLPACLFTIYPKFVMPSHSCTCSPSTLNLPCHRTAAPVRLCTTQSRALGHDWGASQGFFYNRYADPANATGNELGTETNINLNQQLCYHVIGTPQAEDPTVAVPEVAEWMLGAEVTDDGRSASHLRMALRAFHY